MEEYKIEKNNNVKYWETAIGLQKVDDLLPSEYLLELKEKNLNNKLSYKEIENLLYKKYENETLEEKKERKKESDIVSNRIAELLSMNGTIGLNPNSFAKIHKYLFKDIYDFAGEFRKDNIYKNEPILNGDTVKYSNYFQIEDTLIYDMNNEKNINYSKLSKYEIIEKITSFTSRIWQSHPFMEGNTRTTAIFIIQYLNQLGFNINNNMFKDNAKYFRNALVRANYYNDKVSSDNTFLAKFFINLLYNGNFVLKNEDLILYENFKVSPTGEILNKNEAYLKNKEEKINWNEFINNLNKINKNKKSR